MTTRHRESERKHTTLQTVYDGRRATGFLLCRGRDGYEAFDADQRSLGVFTTAKAAADAIPIKGDAS